MLLTVLKMILTAKELIGLIKRAYGSGVINISYNERWNAVRFTMKRYGDRYQVPLDILYSPLAEVRAIDTLSRDYRVVPGIKKETEAIKETLISASDSYEIGDFVSYIREVFPEARMVQGDHRGFGIVTFTIGNKDFAVSPIILNDVDSQMTLKEDHHFLRMKVTKDSEVLRQRLINLKNKIRK